MFRRNWQPKLHSLLMNIDLDICIVFPSWLLFLLYEKNEKYIYKDIDRKVRP